jgi:hypothetical protein
MRRTSMRRTIGHRIRRRQLGAKSERDHGHELTSEADARREEGNSRKGEGETSEDGVKVYIEHFTDAQGEPIVRVYKAKPKEIYPPKSRSGA